MTGPSRGERMPSTPRHIITVALEDYFHVGAFNQLVQRGEWYRFESRLETGARNTLALLDARGVKATFFTLGWVAERMPELVREISERGHEVASKGYYHRSITEMSPAEFVDDLARAQDALERASGRKVLGYRVANERLRSEDLWVLDALASEGYAYDSSIVPRGRSFADEPFRRFAHQVPVANGSIWEFPISSMRLLGLTVPIGGGNYLRQFPSALTRPASLHWMRSVQAPFVLYFHTWELDPEQPRITAAPLIQRLRHYRNLDKMAGRVDWFLQRWSFTSIAGYLGLQPRPIERTPVPAPREITAGSSQGTPTSRPAPRRTISVVVPCFNEELILPYLLNTLRSVQERLAERYDTRFILVDDCSTDDTAVALHRLFGELPNYRILRLPRNSGVAAAILEGIEHATSEVVCSIDCDCSYDPHELDQMIPMLADDVAMVTASPYHPDGLVQNVAAWRLFLSRSASRMYRLVMHNQLATYSSCFRVYRRSAIQGMVLDRGGFLGITELLGRLDVGGHRVVEYPTTLRVRMMGRSKLRVVRAIGGHLFLMTKLALMRLGWSKAGLGATRPLKGDD